MKTILCYGDSNTWGYIPGNSLRLPYEQRWTGRVQLALGDAFLLIEEGLNGRTTVWDDPFKPGRNGLKALPPVLDSHAPIDLVVMMLGTNDLKHFRATYAADAARGAELLIEIIRQRPCGPNPPDGDSPQILLVAPAPIHQLSERLSSQFIGAEEKSRQFGNQFRAVAQQSGVHFFDAAEVIKLDELEDGIHFNHHAHARLAERITKRIVALFSSV